MACDNIDKAFNRFMTETLNYKPQTPERDAYIRGHLDSIEWLKKAYELGGDKFNYKEYIDGLSGVVGACKRLLSKEI